MQNRLEMLNPCTEFEILDGQVKVLEIIMWLLRVKAESFVQAHIIKTHVTKKSYIEYCGSSQMHCKWLKT